MPPNHQSRIAAILWATLSTLPASTGHCTSSLLPQNNSNKAVKKIKVSVRQFADICLFSTAQYKCTVDEKVRL